MIKMDIKKLDKIKKAGHPLGVVSFFVRQFAIFWMYCVFTHPEYAEL